MATRTLRPGTQALYRSQLRRHLLPTFGERQLDDISPADVRSWYAGRIDTGLSTVTVAKQYRLLRAILSTAVDDGLIPTNPCQIRGGGVERSPERTIPTIADVSALADTLPADLRAVPWIAALAGLRKGEILALARRHIDIDGARISVTRSLQEITGQGAVLSPTKSTSGVRVVAIPQRLVDVLEGHLADYVKPHPDALLFTNGRGNPVRNSLWTPAWDTAPGEGRPRRPPPRPPAPRRHAHRPGRRDPPRDHGPARPLEPAGGDALPARCTRTERAHRSRHRRPPR